MALDQRQKESGRPIWIGGVILIAAVVATAVWLKRPRAGDVQTDAPPPAGVSRFSTPSKSASPARAGTPDPAGRSRGPASAGSGGERALSAPVTRGGANEKSGASALTPPLSEPRATAAGSGEAATTPTYDVTNVDVTAPKLLTPIVSTSAPAEPRLAASAAIQIIVNEDGTVDSAKATFTPTTIGETLLINNALSAAKTWRFDPAIKDGHPVKYRLLVPFRVF